MYGGVGEAVGGRHSKGYREHAWHHRALRHSGGSGPAEGGRPSGKPRGGVDSDGLFEPDGLNSVGRAGARSPGTGQTDQQRKWEGVVGRQDQWNGRRGEGEDSTNNGDEKNWGAGGVRRLRTDPPP